MQVLPNSILFEDVEIPLWTHGQLEKLGQPALMQRALNLRDDFGRERVPPMPRHVEGLINWILDVEVAVLSASGSTISKEQLGAPRTTGSAPQSAANRAVSSGVRGAGGASVGPANTEAEEAFQEARNARDAAKARNRGSGIF